MTNKFETSTLKEEDCETLMDAQLMLLNNIQRIVNESNRWHTAQNPPQITVLRNLAVMLLGVAVVDHIIEGARRGKS